MPITKDQFKRYCDRHGLILWVRSQLVAAYGAEEWEGVQMAGQFPQTENSSPIFAVTLDTDAHVTALTQWDGSRGDEFKKVADDDFNTTQVHQPYENGDVIGTMSETKCKAVLRDVCAAFKKKNDSPIDACRKIGHVLRRHGVIK